jgi:hypothetical protein
MRIKIEKLLTGIVVIALIALISIGSLSVRAISTSVKDSSFSVPNLSAQDVFWPGNSGEWTEVLDADTFSEMFEYIENRSYDIHSVIIARNGYLLLEEYLHNSQIYRNLTGEKEYWFGGVIHDQASTTKSLTSMVIGIALQEGFLDNLSQTLYEFYSSIWEPTFVDSKLKKNITIEQLLTMNAGFMEDGHLSYPPNSNTANAVNCIKFALDDLPLTYTPGRPGRFRYCSDAINLLSGIITNVTGKSMEEFAKEYLFEPLSISEDEYIWHHDAQNITYGGYGFLCSPKVQAKLGILCLNKGTWDGIQIIDKYFIKNATTFKIRTDWNDYGYLFYTDGPFDGYYTYGNGGQCIFVIPEYNIVVGFTGLNLWFQYHGLIVTHIVPFADLPENGPDNPGISGFDLNIIFFVAFCISLLVIIRNKKHPMNN